MATQAGYTISIGATHTWQAAVSDGIPFSYIQLTNTGSQSVTVQFNGDSGQQFALAGGNTQIFNRGDVVSTKVKISNTASGALTATLGILLTYAGAAPVVTTT